MPNHPTEPRAAAARPKTKRLKRAVTGVTLALLLLVVCLSAYALYTIEDHNFHVVAAGEVYRSAQMNGDDLARCIQKYGIKSVLNLRGENPTTSWHQTEIATTAKLNAVHYDRSLGSGTELTLEQMDDLVTLLRNAPKPMLIHCYGGADRSGLVSALYCFAIEGQKPEEADRQLTIWYGHVPLIRPKVTAMDDSFWRYVTNDAHPQPFGNVQTSASH
jgi:protein tyrosine/serine phosphatase